MGGFHRRGQLSRGHGCRAEGQAVILPRQRQRRDDLFFWQVQKIPVALRLLDKEHEVLVHRFPSTFVSLKPLLVRDNLARRVHTHT